MKFIEELKKIEWPTKSDTLSMFFVVLVFVLFMAVFLGAVDALFGLM